MERRLIDPVGAGIGSDAHDFRFGDQLPLKSFQLILRPIAFWSLKQYRAIDSLRITTGGAVALSLGWNPRPALSRVPTVSKYPGADDARHRPRRRRDRFEIRAFDLELLLLRERAGQRRRRRHRG